MGLDQPSDRAALNLFHSRDQPRGGNASLGQILGNRVERNLLLDHRLDVTDQVGTFDGLGAKVQALGTWFETA